MLPTNKPLASNFFTKHLNNLGWKLLEAEDITSIHKLKKDRLEAIIKGLRDGTIHFIEVGYPIRGNP